MIAISQITQSHDRWYKSVSFGENLIKEMLFSSVSGVPLSINAAMTANTLMIQRVHRVATAFSPFSSLSLKSQSLLLKHNSDLVVSLRGAVFFEQNKQVLPNFVNLLRRLSRFFSSTLFSIILNIEYISYLLYFRFIPHERKKQCSTSFIPKIQQV